MRILATGLLVTFLSTAAHAQLRVNDGVVDAYTGVDLNLQVSGATQASLTSTGELHIKEVCDENGANCKTPLSLQGSYTAGGAMRAGWPDAIRCANSGANFVLHLDSEEPTRVYYQQIGSAAEYWVAYNPSTRAYAAESNMNNVDCVTNAWSIDDLYTNKRALHFAGAKGVGDADTLDGADSTQYLRNDQDGTFTGYLSLVDTDVSSSLQFRPYSTGAGFLAMWDTPAGGPAVLDFDPRPSDGVSNAIVSVFKDVNTTGGAGDYVGVDFHQGNATFSRSAFIGVNGRNSFLGMHGGKMAIGTYTPVGDVYIRNDNATGINGRSDNQSEAAIIIESADSYLMMDENEIRQFDVDPAAPWALGLSGEDGITISTGDGADGTYSTKLRVDDKGYTVIGGTTAEAILTTQGKSTGSVDMDSSRIDKAGFLAKNTGTGMLAIDDKGIYSFNNDALYLTGEGAVTFQVGDNADGDNAMPFKVSEDAGKVTQFTSIEWPASVTDNDPDSLANRFGHRIVNYNNSLYMGVSDVFNDRKAFLQAGHSSIAYIQHVTSSELVLQAWGGRVGIGTTTPTTELQVNGNIETYHGFGFVDNGILETIPTTETFGMVYDNNLFGTNLDGVIFKKTDQNENTPDGGIVFENVGSDGVRDVGMVIRGTGNVGILMKFPSVAMDVNGSIEYTGTIADVSDGRLKQNVQPLNNQLEKVAKINPVSFEMKDNPGVTEYGVIAQEIQDIYPHQVTVTDDASKTMAVTYQGLIAPLVEAIQELKTMNDEMELKNAALRARIESLEKVN